MTSCHLATSQSVMHYDVNFFKLHRGQIFTDVNPVAVES